MLTRTELLARVFVGGGTVTVGGLLIGGGFPGPAVSRPSREQDVRVLDWLLRLEHLQAAFYTEAEERGELRGELREFADVVGGQERAHVDALERALGTNTAPAGFDFGETTTDPDEFLAAAVQLEEIAVSAFNGQLTNLTRTRVLTAMEIVSVEARHVGWARDLAGRNPAPRPADEPATQDQTRAAIEGTGFLE
jgi:hypothetical protein